MGYCFSSTISGKRCIIIDYEFVEVSFILPSHILLISISLLLVSIHTLQSLIEIRRAFLNFQLTHVPTCTFIPTSIREGYDKYLSDEKKYDDVCDEFVWVSSAIHRGLRDSQFGEKGIVYLPELASPFDLKRTIPLILEYITQQANSNETIQPIQPKKYNIQTCDLLETDILFQPGHSGLELIGHGGNHYWHRIMINLRPTYVVCGLSAKTLIIRLIVKVSRQRNPPGRFLLQDQVSGLWNEIGDEEAEALTYAMMEHEGRHSYFSSGATLAVTAKGHQEDTFDKAFEIAEAMKSLNKGDMDTTDLLNQHLDPNVNPSTTVRPNSAIEEENEATRQPKKKQKLENRSVVDSVSTI